MSYAKSFIIDGIRKYHLFIGFYFEFDMNVYQIQDEEYFYWDEDENTTNTRITAITTLNTATVHFDNTLKPKDGYAYWIEFVGIDGFCGFQPLFKGYPHMTPARETAYLYKTEAGRYNAKYLPHLIMGGGQNYPTYKFYNPSADSNAPHMYFKGWKWKLRLIQEPELSDVIASKPVPVLPNYMKDSMPA